MERGVVVGFDGSRMSTDAVDWAAAQAVRRGCSLRIVACSDVPAESAMVPIAFGTVQDAAKAVETGGAVVLRNVRTKYPGLDALLEVRAGSPTRVLARESADASLLVVGASGHHRAAAFWLGRTARAVVRHGACPVAVVRAMPVGPPQRIIVGVDANPAADAAVRWAADEADRIGIGLTIVHCWWFAYRPVDVASSRGRDIEQVEAARVLDQAVEAARERCGVEVVGMLVEENPIAALLAIGKEGDVLVLGSPSHGAILSSVLGSTVNGVLEESALPVIVVPTIAVAARPGVKRTADGAPG